MKITKETVTSMVTVRKRVADAGMDDLMRDMEERWTAEHPLSKVSALEGLCKMTKTNPQLQNGLLAFVMEDIAEAVNNRVLSKTENAKQVLAHARGSLLARRVLYYLVSKLRLTKADAKSIDKNSPGLGSASDSRTPLGFYNNFLSHKDFRASELSAIISDKRWLSGLLNYQRESLESMRILLEPNQKVCQMLLDVTDKNPRIAAEELLQRQEWDGLLRYSDLMAMRTFPAQVWVLQSCLG